MIPVSLLSAYEYCPRKIFLERVLKLVEPPKEVTVRGTIKHAAIANFARREQSVVEATAEHHTREQLFEDYKKAYTAELRQSIIENKTALMRIRLDPATAFSQIFPTLQPDMNARAENVWIFMQQSRSSGRELWQELTPKIKSEYSLSSPSLKLTGSIDQVHVYPDSLLPFELKSGRAPKEGIWPGHRLQLAAYIMLLEDNFNMNISKGIVHYIDSGETRELNMNSFLRDDVIKTRFAVENVISGVSLPDFVKNKNKCESCLLKEDCYNESSLNQTLHNFNRKI